MLSITFTIICIVHVHESNYYCCSIWTVKPQHNGWSALLFPIFKIPSDSNIVLHVICWITAIVHWSIATKRLNCHKRQEYWQKSCERKMESDWLYWFYYLCIDYYRVIELLSWNEVCRRSDTWNEWQHIHPINEQNAQTKWNYLDTWWHRFVLQYPRPLFLFFT